MADDTKKTLSLARAEKPKIPKLRPIDLAVQVDFLPAGLLDYQRDFATNTRGVKVHLSIDPATFTTTPLQQSLLVNDLTRKPMIDFDYFDVPPGVGDDGLLSVVGDECSIRLNSELIDAESIIRQAADRDIISDVLDRSIALLHRIGKTPSLMEEPLFTTEGGHLFFDWEKFMAPAAFGATKLEAAPKFDFINRNRQINAIFGLLYKVKPTGRTSGRRLCGLLGQVDFSNVAKAILDCVTTFNKSMGYGPIGEAVFGPLDYSRFEFFETEITPLINTAINARNQDIKRVAEVVVTNLPLSAERLQLALAQDIYPIRILYEIFEQHIVQELNQYILQALNINSAHAVDAVMLYTAQFDEYCENLEIDLTNSPSLLMLQTNQAILAFFSSNEWFTSASINTSPSTELNADYYWGEPEQDTEFGDNEWIILKGVYQKPLNPRAKKFTVSVQRLREALKKQSNSNGGAIE